MNSKKSSLQTFLNNSLKKMGTTTKQPSILKAESAVIGTNKNK